MDTPAGLYACHACMHRFEPWPCPFALNHGLAPSHAVLVCMICMTLPCPTAQQKVTSCPAPCDKGPYIQVCGIFPGHTGAWGLNWPSYLRSLFHHNPSVSLCLLLLLLLLLLLPLSPVILNPASLTILLYPNPTRIMFAWAEDPVSEGDGWRRRGAGRLAACVVVRHGAEPEPRRATQGAIQAQEERQVWICVWDVHTYLMHRGLGGLDAWGLLFDNMDGRRFCLIIWTGCFVTLVRDPESTAADHSNILPSVGLSSGFHDHANSVPWFFRPPAPSTHADDLCLAQV